MRNVYLTGTYNSISLPMKCSFITKTLPGGKRFTYFKNVFYGLSLYSSPWPDRCSESTYFEQMNRFVESLALVSLAFMEHLGEHI